MNLPENSVLYADSNRGIYIPQHFAESIKRDCVTGLSEADWRCLEAGPPGSIFADGEGCEWYWETWDRVLNNAVITEPDTGNKYALYQDGDLWLIPVDAEWPDQDWPDPDDIFIPHSSKVWS
jgi:hypothetical protein